jgi:hypothetical protein
MGYGLIIIIITIINNIINSVDRMTDVAASSHHRAVEQ